ncbi:CHAT domain-containing protein [Nostoc sp. UHCC 0251]|uniref:CHAT domain-containing protein n=1 Tax=Nostoc sp. UHCC 0251 TaxID=3110240 RepID=UPI002B21682D|nr:CHAT domain-containing protein [Nostoc sp. UHCC 0251]MEA5626527.1 CHAT domain-containing protein [Nostoc sp. UHCC 0251]
MSTLVILNIGSGDLLSGFPQVTVQTWTGGRSLPEQSVGSLPPAPVLIELYQSWQSTYRCLCNSQSIRSTVLAPEEDDILEIDEAGITNVSQANLDQVSRELCIELNIWLSAKHFLKIERHMRSQLHPTEDIRMILETNNECLRRLPWHKWEIFQDYPKANIALSQPEYRRRQLPQSKVNRNKIRILAILGNSINIDVKAEREFLQNLPNAETTFLVNPSCHEFNTQLWSQLGWDILFFAGHSQTEEQTGKLYINENPTNNSITLEKLEEALKAAIERGLILTIFNSCDGLGLALALERLHIPVVVVMREPVPNRVAQEFLRYFLEAFAIEQLSFNQAMRQSCRKLQGLEEDFPGASWLPISCQNPAIELPTWLELDGMLHQSLQVNLEQQSTDDLILVPGVAQEQEPPLQLDAEPTVTFEINSQPSAILTLEQYSCVEEILTELIGPIAFTLIQIFKAQPLTFRDLVEELAVYLSLPQITEFEQQVTPLFQKPSAQSQVQIDTPVISNEQEITDVLVCEYEQALAEIIGPIAVFLVQDALASSPQISRVELIEMLSDDISNPQKAAEFRQRFLN